MVDEDEAGFLCPSDDDDDDVVGDIVVVVVVELDASSSRLSMWHLFFMIRLHILRHRMRYCSLD